MSAPRVLSLSLLLLLAVPGFAEAEERKTVAKRADCEITVGDREEADGTDLVIATCAWPIAPEKVISAVSKVETHGEVLSSVAQSTRLPDGRVLQVHQNSGIADRQITLDFTDTKRPDGGFRTSWTRSAKQEPLGEGRIDAPKDDGYWDVTPDGSGGSKVVYGLRYDPGGKVPMWIVRSFQKGGIGDIVEQMRAAAEKQ